MNIDYALNPKTTREAFHLNLILATTPIAYGLLRSTRRSILVNHLARPIERKADGVAGKP